MSNVIPITRAARTAPPVPECAISAIDDDELDVRLWELVMSGQRGSPVYLGIEHEILRRRSRPTAA